MKDKYTKLKALLLAGTIALSSSTLTGCSSDNSEKNELIEESTIHFDAGKHIISEPIGDVRFENFQYDYHPGYEPVGISLTSYGISGSYGGGAIIYSNTEEVECSSVSKDENGEYLYSDFGTPLYSNEGNKEDINEDFKNFGIGEHIISVPIKEDNRHNKFQYDYHEGYEIVGMASCADGKYQHYNGGVLLYTNVTPVICIRNDNGYTSFGVPVEKTKTKTLK